MEMPTSCQNCGEWFELNSGYESNKWYPTNTICVDCSLKEDEEIEKDEQIQDLKNQIADAKFDIKEWEKRLKELEL